MYDLLSAIKEKKSLVQCYRNREEKSNRNQYLVYIGKSSNQNLIWSKSGQSFWLIKAGGYIFLIILKSPYKQHNNNRSQPTLYQLIYVRDGVDV